MENSIESLFRNELGNAAVTPPPNIWDKLDTHLASSDVSSLYRNRFSKDEEKPPRGVWFAIQRQLWLQEFMRFNVARVNVYYVASALLAGVGLAYWGTQNETVRALPNTQIVAQTHIAAPTLLTPIVAPKNQVNSPQVIENKQTNLIEAPQQAAVLSHSASKAKIEKDTPSEIRNNNHEPKQSIKMFAFPKNLSVVGDATVCENSEHVYTVSGTIDSKASISWQVPVGEGQVTVLSANKVLVNWTKNGASQVTVQLLQDGQMAQTTYPVQVVDNTTSTVVGKTMVCEGSKAVSYRVTNKQDLNKMYTWKTTKSSTLVIPGNGFVKIDFNTVGVDSVILSETNTQTGCQSRTAIPVQIMARPVVDFTIRENGNGEFEFLNSSRCGGAQANCHLTTKWNVGENAYSATNLRYQFETSGNYTIGLLVQDQNNCTTTLDREVQIVVGKLFFPTAYNFNSRLNGFTPVGENLANYKIEIFTADNVKLWESTLLMEGKPAEAWDGMINGQKAPLGSYFWRVQASFKEGGEWKGVLQNGQYKKTGSFLLLE